jgi:hypothetical protein
VSDLKVDEPHRRSIERPVTSTVFGAFILLCAVTAAVLISVPEPAPSGAPNIWWHRLPTWPLLTVWAASGAVIMTHPRLARPTAMIAGMAAAQVAMIGPHTISNFFLHSGLGGIAKPELAMMVTYAVAVVLAATAATVAAVALAWREPAGWRGLVPVRPAYLVAGAAVIFLLPAVLHVVPESWKIFGFGQLVSWTFSVPWGLGIAATGWLRGRTAVAAVITVLASAVLCTAYLVGPDVIAYYFPPPD